ncbi:aldehyde dehydrogenase family protein [Engelhardtia mirabilis]|uniref:aldehyde dehydrogenase (NAD(+)) n=1 Tax=Engelhardtia mirabilis TaxID=2528011 RepID=A0A518BJF7_9BACT|nr:Succinate-semialdehyde dehydrogenase [NADP(+)] [Planctomycetes bacterium Pla133]QDV01444.1 Succinate-semialdehyde dehydrogenase [NADP(+)] [Planctomycetes bacterium Pla86]
MTAATAARDVQSILRELGLDGQLSGAYAGEWIPTSGPELEVRSPGTGEVLARIPQAGAAEYERCVEAAQAAFLKWREKPAPLRGEIVRRMGERLRAKKDALGALVTLEMGKILQEGLGEVQEAIDIADFAVGQSRMLYGLSMHSERPGHAMREQWHPLGICGVISAFNFPVAVWAWNSMIALICGDACIWKPSPKAPLCAIATTKILAPVLEEEGLGALLGLVIGTNEEVGERLVADRRVPLISFTGSTRVGREVAAKVAGRLGKSILELGGNNAMVVTENADLDLAIPAIVFGSVGTCGQRCTTTRRVLVADAIADEVERRLVAAYDQVRIGNPLADGTLCGPLIDSHAVEGMQRTLEEAKQEGAELVYGGEVLSLDGDESGGHYVKPCIMRASNSMSVVQHETFAPILYLIRVADLDEAIAQHNDVPQGLSSAIFSSDVREAERFLSAVGSDCGIANVNIGTSGAEIGGAFGGEKDTGGGRESGSDAWKAYMRRQTNTVNWSRELPLAQGISFG